MDQGLMHENHGTRLLIVLWLTATVLSTGCATSEPARSPAPVRGAPSPVCGGLVGRFVGLPASLEQDTPLSSQSGAPLAGSWWIRSCSTRRTGSELSVSIDGPGWYWIDAERGGVALHQQVGLELSAQVTGTLSAGYGSGVVSVWFTPSREAVVDVTASENVQPKSKSLRSSLLQWLAPGLMKSKVASDLSAEATDQLRAKLAHGVTVTYDVWRNQADLALEQLKAGQTPAHPLGTDLPWLVNERMLLPPGATQAFGPFAADTAHRLDIINRAGPGLEFRAVRASAMSASLEALRDGRPDRLAPETVIDSGTVSQPRGTVALVPQDWPFYLVFFSTGDHRAVADILVVD